MAVDGDGVPAERAPFVCERFQCHVFLGRAVEGHAVAVNEDDQIAELILVGVHCRLPDRAFAALAVADDGVDAAA